jgi:cyd operon protein YbgT
MWHFSWTLGAGLACAFVLLSVLRQGLGRECWPVLARSRR